MISGLVGDLAGFTNCAHLNEGCLRKVPPSSCRAESVRYARIRVTNGAHHGSAQ